jgi:uncharacterized protein YhbP (UPF0306 family)
MPPEALEFLKHERVGVLAVRMKDGSPHAATVHFAVAPESSTFIFLTSPTYRKVEPLKQGDTAASLVVGTNEEVMKTLQLDGVARLEDSEEIRSAYFGKFPEKQGKHRDDLVVTFRPSWWRYTDWTFPDGKTIFLSDGTKEVIPRSS